MQPTACSAAILVGGGATRMGGDKLRIKIQGTTLLRRVYRVAVALSDDVLLVGNNAAAYADLAPEARLVADHVGTTVVGGGPLGGIVAALVAARHELVVVLAADLPFVDPVVVRLLIERAMQQRADAVIPVIESDRPESLHAVYRTTCLPVARAMVDSGVMRIAAVFPHLHTVRIGAHELAAAGGDLGSFLNVNTPEDLARVNRLHKHSEVVP